MKKLYTIWIIPPEPVYSEVKKIINSLSEKYSGPEFEPHMTLLGNIDLPLPEVIKRTRVLAKSIKKLNLISGPVFFSTTYFQSALLRINSSAELIQLNLEAKKLMDMNNDVFMPHISLMYGDHSMEIRERAASEIKFPKASFVAYKFTITPSTKNPLEWKHLEEIAFG